MNLKSTGSEILKYAVAGSGVLNLCSDLIENVIREDDKISHLWALLERLHRIKAVTDVENRNLGAKLRRLEFTVHPGFRQRKPWEFPVKKTLRKPYRPVTIG